MHLHTVSETGTSANQNSGGAARVMDLPRDCHLLRLHQVGLREDPLAMVAWHRGTQPRLAWPLDRSRATCPCGSGIHRFAAKSQSPKQGPELADKEELVLFTREQYLCTLFVTTTC